MRHPPACSVVGRVKVKRAPGLGRRSRPGCAPVGLNDPLADGQGQAGVMPTRAGPSAVAGVGYPVADATHAEDPAGFCASSPSLARSLLTKFRTRLTPPAWGPLQTLPSRAS